MTLHLMDGLVFKPHCAVILLLLIHNHAALSQVIVPSQPVVAVVGDDVLLPCQLKPATDASEMAVEWSRQDLNPRYVFVLRETVELVTNKNPAYEGKTSMNIPRLKLGDVSLKLSKVKVSDGGMYKCFVPTVAAESTVKLVVGTASSIVLRLVKTENDETLSGGGVVLQCESAGWYPEPEVLWLDAEGNLLSAGPPETVRGPDDLYTVSSRVTVDKKDSKDFTCRVQQNDINQTREAHIHVADDVFVPGNSPVGHITISLIVMFIVILAVVFVVVKWSRRQRSKDVTSSTTGTSSNHEEVHLVVEEEREKPQVTGQSLNISDLNEKEINLKKELQTLEEERIYVVGAINLLMSQKNNLENQMCDITKQRNEIQSEQEAITKPKEQGKTKKIKKDKKKTIPDLETRKDNVERELKINKTAHESVVYVVNMLTEKKKVLENHKNEIDRQLEEIKKQRDEVQTQISSDQT